MCIVVIADRGRQLQIFIALGGEGNLKIIIACERTPYAGTILVVHLASSNTIGKPTGGLAGSIAQRQQSSILCVSLIVGSTFGFGCIVVKIPTHNEICCREIGCDMLLRIHLDVILGTGALSITFPTGKGQDAVVYCCQFDIGTFLIVVYTIHIVAGGQELYEVLIRSACPRHVQGIDVILRIGSHQCGMLCNLKAVGVLLRYGFSFTINPSCKMVAEVLGGSNRQ